MQSFAFAIGTDAGTLGHLERLAEYDLVVLDGVDAPTPLVDGLRARGVLVLAYLSVGTIETGRPWSAEARPYRLERWTDWREWYADVAAAAFRKLLTNDVAPSLLARGFDGIFLDNVDMVADH
ncbi:MAG TPA: endo alpha-1,4 polygalactosaminidase, partial [Acidimicrobiia bacterium]|nr:endo alpha-1,4 polygalactosaminidase [Acidimicrobiia bacterium]